MEGERPAPAAAHDCSWACATLVKVRQDGTGARLKRRLDRRIEVPRACGADQADTVLRGERRKLSNAIPGVRRSEQKHKRRPVGLSVLKELHRFLRSLT